MKEEKEEDDGESVDSQSCGPQTSKSHSTTAPPGTCHSVKSCLGTETHAKRPGTPLNAVRCSFEADRRERSRVS